MLNYLRCRFTLIPPPQTWCASVRHGSSDRHCLFQATLRLCKGPLTTGNNNTILYTVQRNREVLSLRVISKDEVRSDTSPIRHIATANELSPLQNFDTSPFRHIAMANELSPLQTLLRTLTIFLK